MKDVAECADIALRTYQDLGFDGIDPELGTDDNVINKYFDEYFPRAVRAPTRVPHSGICVHSHPMHSSSVNPHRAQLCRWSPCTLPRHCAD